MSNEYTFKLDLKIWDREALYDAAVRHAVEVDNMPLNDIRELLRPGTEVNVHACLQMLLDPGLIDGCDIYGSEVEQWPSFDFADTEGDGL